MRTIFVIALLVAGVCAFVAPESSFVPDTPARQDSSYNLVEQLVVDAIEELKESFKEDGLDPFQTDRDSVAYQLPVPELFNAAAFVEGILFTGLSNIVIKNMDYSYLFFRLRFELELPRLQISARAAGGDLSLFGNSLTAAADGRVDIRETVVSGQANVRLGIISGIYISSITVDFNLGSISSYIRLAIQGDNYSQNINNFLSSTVPSVLQEFRVEVNQLLGIILLDILG